MSKLKRILVALFLILGTVITVPVYAAPTTNNFFANTNVTMGVGQRLATEYMRLQDQKNGKSNIKYSCPRYVTENNDDRLTCYRNGKDVEYFLFDDLKESKDADIQYGIGDAVCRMYGGKYQTETGICKKVDNDNKEVKYKCGICDNVDINTCNKTIGWRLKDAFGYKATFVPSSKKCTIDFLTKGANYEPKHTLVYKGVTITIDYDKFENLQLRYSQDLKFLLRRYVERMIEESKTGAVVQKFNCKDGFQTWEKGFFEKDDIILCDVMLDDGKAQQLEFVFDDVNEALGITATGGTAGLTCIADSGGVYAGGKCHGLKRSQCDDLRTKKGIKTKWDATLDTCILTDAQDAEKLNKATKYAEIIGGTVVAVGLTVGTGGTVWIIAAGAAGVTAQAMHDGYEGQCDKKIDEIFNTIDTKIPPCAKKLDPINACAKKPSVKEQNDCVDQMIETATKCFFDIVYDYLEQYKVCSSSYAIGAQTSKAFVETLDAIVKKIYDSSPIIGCNLKHEIIDQIKKKSNEVNPKMVSLKVADAVSVALAVFGGYKSITGIKDVLNAPVTLGNITKIISDSKSVYDGSVGAGKTLTAMTIMTYPVISRYMKEKADAGQQACPLNLK